MAMELLCRLLLLEMELLHIATMKKNRKKKEEKIDVHCYNEEKKEKGKRRGRRRQLALRFRREVGSKKEICS
jgi:hypothetical protein